MAIKDWQDIHKWMRKLVSIKLNVVDSKNQFSWETLMNNFLIFPLFWICLYWIVFSFYLIADILKTTAIFNILNLTLFQQQKW